MPERDYSRRDVVDKLGINPGSAVVFGRSSGYLHEALRQRILARVGRPVADAERADVILADVDEATDAVDLLRRHKAQLKPTGGIWLLTRKRGQPGYVDQRALIAAGQAAGLVDNKVCSVSNSVSAMRFVIRRADR
jgi:hypothetical protein